MLSPVHINKKICFEYDTGKSNILLYKSSYNTKKVLNNPNHLNLIIMGGPCTKPPPMKNSCLYPRLVVKLKLEFLPKMAEKVRKKLELTPKNGLKKVRIFLF